MYLSLCRVVLRVCVAGLGVAEAGSVTVCSVGAFVCRCVLLALPGCECAVFSRGVLNVSSSRCDDTTAASCVLLAL